MAPLNNTETMKIVNVCFALTQLQMMEEENGFMKSPIKNFESDSTIIWEKRFAVATRIILENALL